MVEDVTERLREAILQGHLSPGEHLREEQLAAMLDVSRGPVRAALAQLEHEGLVIARRYRGMTVARLSHKDLEEVYSLRLALERLATQYVIYQGTDEDFAAMEAVVQEFRATVGRDISEREAAELDLKFHDLLYQASRHERLQNAWANLRAQVFIFLVSRNIANPGFREHMINSHAELLSAIRARDEARAIPLLEEHLRWAYVRIVQRYTALEKADAPSSIPPFLNPSR
ncbi:MAG: GntR family transcriptional regulator [Anaerolineae bacterium]|nr:GntR family transcriptional regulator [Anaerolineae bacterium]